MNNSQEPLQSRGDRIADKAVMASLGVAALASVVIGGPKAYDNIKDELDKPNPTSYDQIHDDLLGDSSAPAPEKQPVDQVDQIPESAMAAEFSVPVEQQSNM